MEQSAMQAAVLGLIRHALTVVGGYLVASGDLEPQHVETIAGAVAVLIGVLWSILDKRART